MNKYEYYKKVFPKLKNLFEHFHYFVGAGKELIDIGWNPNNILVAVEPVDKLYRLSCELGLQVHIPVVGINSEYILAPIDFEISLTGENYKLYENKDSQNFYFLKMVTPLLNYLQKLFLDFRIPYLMDLTPSGGHILFLVKRGTKSWDAFKNIGFLEPDMLNAYKYREDKDIKRRYGVGEDAGLVFSGIGRLAEYIGIRAKKFFGNNIEYPISFCDSSPQSLNFDISWAADAAYMRSIRTPYSLHKKNIEKYYMKQDTLVDIIHSEYDGNNLNKNLANISLQQMLDCMWNLDLAAQYYDRTTGIIPVMNDSIIQLINEYKNSDLYKFHYNFDYEKTLPYGDAVNNLINNPKISQRVKNMLNYPEPSMLQPMQLKPFIEEIVFDLGYSSKFAGCVIRDYYQNCKYHWYGIDWYKYPSEPRAFFWARLYSDVSAFERNKLQINHF